MTPVSTLNLNDPLTLALLAAGAVALLLIVLLIVSIRRAGRSAALAEMLASQMGGVTSRVQLLSDGQQQLFGGLTAVTEAQAQQQARTLRLMEERLARVTETVSQNLSSSARNTAQSLGELQQRLKTIDKAQENITKLSGDVLSLQDILSNKQTRGAFGEIQLHDIVSKALPSDSYALQASLSNGKRADCLIHLPNPPGPIVIDSKFPLEAYEKLRAAKTDHEVTQAGREFRTAVRAHIKAISEKYIIEGETADGALMFLPSEAVYAELHANYPEVVREGFAARVWIVSPTTCMATLNTMRAILKDARMREQAGAIRTTLRQLHRDVEIVVERVDKLNTHFGQARADLDGIGVAAERAGKRAARLDNFDFEELAADPAPPLVAAPK
ncbi:MAG: DNA recombination protein RmuC [Limimaricola sp.]|uniref:DNA recombination protein RmuC n=1 Tax=Limimaricola sp. TaxID=2211665 RepID=UPI001D5109F3|nr:DNA recombination protein RmuC [Limimaricola sp.]MBI1416953.1 DNA recombination protein RmuC [Limimaricola sp.]